MNSKKGTRLKKMPIAFSLFLQQWRTPTFRKKRERKKTFQNPTFVIFRKKKQQFFTIPQKRNYKELKP
jgi:hypothetical protein